MFDGQIFIEIITTVIISETKKEADYHHVETKEKMQITVAKQRRGRMLNLLLLLFQKIIK